MENGSDAIYRYSFFDFISKDKIVSETSLP